MLYDEIVGSPFVRACQYPWIKRLNEATVFDISDVARYVERHYDDAGRPLDLTHDLPTLGPPAPVCWMEYDTAGYFGPERRRLACLMTYFEFDHDATPGNYPEARWMLDTFPILEHIDGSITVDDFVVSYLLDGAGRILGGGRHDYQYEDLQGLDPADEQTKSNVVKSFPGLLAICFSHHRGVSVQDCQPSRQQRRAWERKHKTEQPLVTFKTIDIAPVTRLLQDDGQIAEHGLHHALSLVRGHFRHYEPGKFFGRNKEPVTFFVPQHMRGTSEAGVRFHDYRVRTPHEVSTKELDK